MGTEMIVETLSRLPMDVMPAAPRNMGCLKEKSLNMGDWKPGVLELGLYRMSRKLVAAALLMVAASNVASATQCSVDKAVYRSANPKSDYQLTFSVGDKTGSFGTKIKLVSKASDVRFAGTIRWQNGTGAPIALLSRPTGKNLKGQVEPSEEDVYEDEIIGLALNSENQIVKAPFFTEPSEIAPPAVLLNHLSYRISLWARGMSGFKTDTLGSLPGGMFWLSSCDR
jgi:hypothetical protein